MLRAYKVEINPTEDQALKIRKTIGTCRYIYNMYLATNNSNYENGDKFINAYDFSKWLNNIVIPNHSDYNWIKDVSSKAVKQSIFNAEHAFKEFFKKKKGKPKFKKKNASNTGCYFPKNNKTDWVVERHRVKVPTLGFVRLKEFGYIPKDAEVTSGTITQQAGRYFVSILVKIKDNIVDNNVKYDIPIGVDLGLKDFAIVSNGKVFKNINKGPKIRKLEKRLKREQRRLSRKTKKEKATKASANYGKQLLRVQKLHFHISNMRKEYVRSVVNNLVKTKPKYVAIEDLNVSGMMRNRHLSKAIQGQLFYYFRIFLIQQCNKYGIEVRVIDRFYPSSKKCHCCGRIKKDLKLSDRVYICQCGNKVDRDHNAALNIRDCETYKIAS